MSALESVAHAEPQAQPRVKAAGPVETQRSVLRRGIALEGEVTGSGDLVVLGKVKGNIRLDGHQVTIEEGGRVEGDIQAETIVIRGEFVGNAEAAGLVNLQKTANFEGELKAARLQMENGAKLKGGVDLQMG
ncbi:MAG: polymer-forming cytoskeletal protein [Nitrospinota bacterium]